MSSTEFSTCRLGSRFNWSLRGCQLPYNLRTLKLGEDFNQSMEGVWDPGISEITGVIGWLDGISTLAFRFRHEELKWKWRDDWYATRMFRQNMNQQTFAQFRLPDLGDTVKNWGHFPKHTPNVELRSIFQSSLGGGFFSVCWTHWWRLQRLHPYENTDHAI